MRYLIVGNSAAATGAIEAIRAVDPDGELLLVGSEPYHVYSRPLISYYLAGKARRDNIFFRPADFYKKHKVTTYLGERAVKLVPANQYIRIEPSGLEIEYDRLLVATGGQPVMPACFSGDYNNLFHFHQLQDVEKISASLKPDSRILIVGGGLIGLKAAESLCKRGLKVHVLEASAGLLNSILDQEAGNLVAQYLEANGIEITTGQPAVEVRGEKSIDTVVLDDGTELSCDLFILAAGVKPNIAWVNKAVTIKEGIVVDEFMCSSQPNIYAAGDVVQSYEPVSEEHKVVPLWPFAYRQGRIAGANMAGQITRYEPEPAFNSIPLLGLNIATAGISSTSGKGFDYLCEKRDPWNYKKLIIAENRLKGFIFTGDISRCGIYRFLIEEEVDITSFKSEMLKADFGMIDLPAQYRLAAR